MKKKIMKSAGCILLAITMILSMVGCGGKDGASNSGTSSKLDKDHVYAYTDLDFGEKFDDVRSVFYANDRIYVVSVTYGNSEITRLNSCKLDGTDIQSIILEGSDGTIPEEVIEPETTEPEDAESEEAVDVVEPRTSEVAMAEEVPVGDSEAYVEGEPYNNTYSWMSNYAFDSKGNLYATEEKNTDSMDEEGNYASSSEYNLVCWNSTGELLWSKDLKEGVSNDEYFYVSSLLIDGEDNVYMMASGKICLFDTQGNKVQEKEISEEEMGTLYLDKSGNPFLIGWNTDYTKQFSRKIDKNTLQLSEGVELPSVLYNYGMMQGKNYDLMLTSSSGIFGYNLGDQEATELMDYVDSDLESSSLSYITALNETQFAACYNDMDTWAYHVAVFTKVDPADVVDKTSISFGCFYMDYNVKRQIVKFNKTNSKYRIQIKDYSMFSTSEDYLAGYTQLNNDILTGNTPDIMVVDANMPIDSYIAKGILEDLNPYIDADEELNREDYLTNVLNAFSVDGKLYQLAPRFSVFTVMGKTSDVGAQRGWTLEDLEKVMASKPEGTQSFAEMNRANILYYAIMLSSKNYIDQVTGECHFDSPGFIHLLEFMKQFPEEIDYSVYEDDNYWENYETMYRDGRALLQATSISQYSDFNRIEKVSFGEDVTLIGFPTENKDGSAIMADLSMAMSAKSKSKDGVWEFMRYYLTDDYQENGIEYAFPIKLSALEKQGAKAMERPYWENEDGTKEYYDDTYQLNGVDVKIEPMTQQEVDEFTDFLKSIDQVGNYSSSLTDIINEEAAAFFADQKSAEEVAKIIQSRIQIYISENR